MSLAIGDPRTSRRLPPAAAAPDAKEIHGLNFRQDFLWAAIYYFVLTFVPECLYCVRCGKHRCQSATMCTQAEKGVSKA